jgi:hypothetical protein
MSNRISCSCQSCTIRSFVGPAVVITLGVLWLLSEVHGGILDWRSTWPVFLIVIGLLHLASSMASREGHVSSLPPQGAPPASPAPPAPPAGNPQAPYSSQGQ